MIPHILIMLTRLALLQTTKQQTTDSRHTPVDSPPSIPTPPSLICGSVRSGATQWGLLSGCCLRLLSPDESYEIINRVASILYLSIRDNQSCGIHIVSLLWAGDVIPHILIMLTRLALLQTTQQHTTDSHILSKAVYYSDARRFSQY